METKTIKLLGLQVKDFIAFTGLDSNQFNSKMRKNFKVNSNSIIWEEYVENKFNQFLDYKIKQLESLRNKDIKINIVAAIQENRLQLKDFISFIGSTPTKFRHGNLNSTNLGKEFKQFLNHKINQIIELKETK